MPIFKNRAFTDAIILFVLFVVGYFFFSHIEAFEAIVYFADIYEEWELDEAITSLTLIGIAGFIYAVRRNYEARIELKKRKAAESNGRWLAQNDPLTKLPNRRFLNNFLQKFDDNHSLDKGTIRYAIYSIDLDGFKQVNDLHGHAGGDALLQKVADRLAKTVPDDLIIRLGGDEFLAIVDATKTQDVHRLGLSLFDAVRKPMKIDSIHAEVGASIGYVVYPDQVATLENAVRSADIAMYAAKKNASRSVVPFSHGMGEEAASRARLEHALRLAVRNDDIVPYYQPLIDFETDKVYGFEVLARWITQDGKLIEPTIFIPLAEQIGVITELSDKLLNQACEDAAKWPSDLMLSFNLSPTQLADRLIGLRIISILADKGFLPSRLEIEITESAMVHDVDSALAVLGDLQSAGIHTALDDFGTGYSSLSQIAKFNFNRIKIDRSFISEFELNEKQHNIVKAIIALGAGLDISTTAEGVETDSQLAALKALGCACGQGHLLGRPMPARQVATFIAGDGDGFAQTGRQAG